MLLKCDVCGKEIEAAARKAGHFIACDECKSSRPEDVEFARREKLREKVSEKKRYWEEHPEEYREYLIQRKAKADASKIAKHGSLEAAEKARIQKQLETLREKYPDEDWDNITNPSQLSSARKKIKENLKKKDSDFYKERQAKADASKIAKYGSLEAAHKSMAEKIQKTNMERYGVANIMQDPEIKARSRETFRERLQEDGFLEERREKTESTKIAKYGSLKATYDSMVEKCRETNLERYGVANAAQNPEIAQKVRASFKKHAEEDPNFLKERKAKTERTVIEKYGSLEAFHSIRKKGCLEKYGVEFPFQSEEIRSRTKDTLRERYGVDNPSQMEGHSERMTEALQKSISEFEEANGCTSFSRLVDQYGQGWMRLDLPRIHSGRFSFVSNELIPQIEEYVYACNSQTSRSEKDLTSFIKSIYKGPVQENMRNVISPMELDIYLPEKNLAVEFNGDFWHSSECKEKNYHEKKSKLCALKNIRLIHVYECEWIHDKEKIKSLLRIALGVGYSKIGARECEVRKISNQEAKPFNEKNHLQGHRNAQVTYGLFHKGELQQLMSFSKTKYNRNLKNDNEWEIIRGCPGSNNQIVGGVSKLFKAFLREYDPDAVFSYCDFNKFDGRGYEALGMKFLGYTGPDKFYVDKSECKIGRNPKKRKELEESCLYTIYGAGSKKYMWRKQSDAEDNQH